MANAVRKIAEYLGLFEGNEYSDEYGTEMPQEGYQETAVSPVAAVPSPASTSVLEQQVRPSVATVGELSRITTLHPVTYNDARRIGEEFRDGTPVILNLTDMHEADARRVVDFAAGLAFGLRGTIEKVTKDVFLLSPANVDCGAAARAQLRQDPFFNQS